jgi:uncharacterized protein
MSEASVKRPDYVFGRADEWADMVAFASAPGTGARMGLVYGRRRQGKTLLLEALCEATGGFLWQARQQSSSQNLAELELAIGRHTGTTPRLSNWDEALASLLDLRSTNNAAASVPVVIDEVGYLIDSDRSFASRLQAALSPAANRRRSSSVRLILCGSAFGQMRKLVDSGAPLRGRSQLDLVLGPFRFREAAEYWGLGNNPDAAFCLHALIGGTPAYREFVAGVGPQRGNVDQWVADQVLAASSPLLREGRVSVFEDSNLMDRTLYWSVLGAIASGATSRAEITRALDRPPTSLHHALEVLVESGWVAIERDPLKSRGFKFVIDEPIVRLHQLVIEPAEARLARRGFGRSVWDDAQPLVRSRIYGPHLESLAREWVQFDALEETVGGRVAACGPCTVGSRSKRLELDIAAVEISPRGARTVCAVGEVKSGHDPVGLSELDRLDRAVDLLAPSTSAPKRILVARAGFTRELTQAARRRGDTELVDLARLYGEHA